MWLFQQMKHMNRVTQNFVGPTDWYNTVKPLPQMQSKEKIINLVKLKPWLAQLSLRDKVKSSAAV